MYLKNCKIIFYCLFALPIFSKAQNIDKISVDNFYFRKASANDVKWFPAVVPGTVHTDLLKNKVIEDPFYSTNEQKLQWIEKEDWEYKSEFIVSDEQYKSQHLELVFEGLDTYADVYVNKVKLASTNNMYRTWKFDIKPLLKKGKNELIIYFHSAYNYAIADVKKYSVELPAGNDRGEVKTSVFTRKAPCQYGWDWGPRFVTCGIWRPVYIQAWSDFKINDLYFELVKLDEAKASYNLKVNINSTSNKSLNYILKVNGKELVNINSKAKDEITIPFNIEDPKLWWPNGYGESYLYDVELEVNNGKNSEKSLHKLGVRTVKLMQPKDSIGSAFYFEVNGSPIFMKGANYIPMDAFLPSTTLAKKDSILKMVVSSNMNMLRVWGGGIYEDNSFYDLCDKYGILVWQDFMFACSLYPWDSAFVDNVKHEAIDNIKRIRNHASLALWCGNNEMNEAWHNWGWQKQYKWNASDSATIWHGYQAIFEKLLPDMVSLYDNQHSYVSSSPKIGWGRADSYKNGDSHYWGVWWGMAPFETYKTKVGRFASEYGFQAMPDFMTINRFLPKDQMNINSAAMRSHQKHASGFETINQYQKWYFPESSNLVHSIYLSQLTQSYGIKIAIEAHRSNKPYCMGTLYWQLNDCWPSISWSSIDYYLQPKALNYQVKRSYSHVLICAEKNNDKLIVSIISDKLRAFNGKLNLKLMNFKGIVIWQKQESVDVSANGVAKIEYKYNENFKQNDSASTFLQMELLEEDSIISENNYFFCYPKNLVLPEAKPFMQIEKLKTGEYFIKLKSKTLVKDYCLMSSIKGVLSDNYFDLLPNQEKIIVFKTKETISPVFESIYLNDFKK
ncbi:MAG: glycoside hydrolase family 2 protein [Bacteroidota bacterium]